MIMSKSEIQADYRDAKDRRKIIAILADQNCCSKKDMRAYLREECGFDVYEPKGPSKEQLEKTREVMRKALRKEKEEREYTSLTDEEVSTIRGEFPDIEPLEEENVAFDMPEKDEPDAELLCGLPFVDVPQDNVRIYADNDGGVWSPDAKVDRETGEVIEMYDKPAECVAHCIDNEPQNDISIKDVRAEAFRALTEMYGKVEAGWVEGFMQGIELVIRMMEEVA